MKVPLQQEILDVLKQRLLPDISEIKADIVQLKADNKVIIGRLDQMDKRFDKVDEEIRELKNDLREVRSYVFTSYLSEKTCSAVREK